jgi:o-succinylbenzoate---CoA ligase
MTNSIPKININTIAFLTSDLEVIDAVHKFVEEWNENKDEMTLFTSGSTGLPKAISHKKTALLASAKATGKYFNFKAGEKLALCLSISTIGGKMQVIRSLLWDMPLIVTDVSRNPLLQLNERIRFCSLTPIQLERIYEESPEKLKLIDTILLGGASVSTTLIEKIEQLNLNVYEGFGMTETVSHIALRKIQHSKFKIQNFKCLEGVSIAEMNGKLIIKAPHLGIEHLETNDEIKLINPKEFRWLGRTDFVINSGGYKFHPEVLEQKLSPFLSLPFFIIGEKDTEFQEIVTFFIGHIYNKELEANLTALFATHFSPYEKPKKMYFVGKFELTSSGKIDKKKTQLAYFESQT